MVVGSAGIVPDGWVKTEIEYLNLLLLSDWQRYFEPNSIYAVLAEHVWEHLTPDEGLVAARNCHAYLRPGGYLRIAVPDGNHPDPDYIEWTRAGGSGAGAFDHKVLYTQESLGRMLDRAGFEVEWLEYFDSTHQFHFTDWKPEDGLIRRSRRFDERNRDGGLSYTSLLADARKAADPRERSTSR